MRFAAALVLAMTVFCAMAAPAECVLNDQSSADDLLSFLRDSQSQPPEQRDRQCITFALNRLQYKKPEPARMEEASTLVASYLDFDVGERHFGSRITPEYRYPAISTLFTFGKAAVPALLSAIGNSDSELIAGNATVAIMAIFREEPEKGIETLAHAAARAQPLEAARLWTAAKLGAKRCGGKSAQCEKVLADNKLGS